MTCSMLMGTLNPTHSLTSGNKLNPGLPSASPLLTGDEKEPQEQTEPSPNLSFTELEPKTNLIY